MFNIKMTCKRIDNNNPDMPNMDAWRVTLRFYSRRMSFPFYLGYGHNGRAPELGNVLSCLFSDASAAENAGSFEAWCSEFGYDIDSRKAERTYKACKRIAVKLRNFLPECYDQVAAHVQDL